MSDVFVSVIIIKWKIFLSIRIFTSVIFDNLCYSNMEEKGARKALKEV